MKTFKQQYKALEMKVHSALRDRIENSTIESEHVQGKCIPVNHLEFKELAIIHDKLAFLDDEGYEFSIFFETASLEDLICILEQYDELNPF